MRKRLYRVHVLIITALCLSLFLASCNSLQESRTESTNKQLVNMSVEFVRALFDDNQDVIKELTIEGKTFGILQVGRGSAIEIAKVRQNELTQEGDKYKSVLEVNLKNNDENRLVIFNIFFSQVDGKWKISDFKLSSK